MNMISKVRLFLREIIVQFLFNFKQTFLIKLSIHLPINHIIAVDKNALFFMMILG